MTHEAAGDTPVEVALNPADRSVVAPLPWSSRISSMPYLPGASDRQVDTLRHVLEAIDAADGVVTAKIDLGDGAKRTIAKAVAQITPAGLVTRLGQDRVAVSEGARRWLESRQVMDLLAVLHRHVRFVGELLDVLTTERRTVRDLVEIASSRYRLQWTTADQVRRRLGWLISMGLVEWSTTKLLGLTDAGRHQLESLEMGAPEAFTDSEVDNAPQVEASEWAMALAASQTPADLSGRNPVLGYIPRGGQDVVQAISLLVNACSPQITRADLYAYMQEVFKLSEGSFGAVLTTLTKSGLVDQVGYNVFAPTPSASRWLEDPNALDLALLIHTRYRLVLEIVPLLAEYEQAPQLARAGVAYYGLARVDASSIRTRMRILEAAGLIYEYATWRFKATRAGQQLVELVPLQAPTEVAEAVSDSPSSYEDADAQTSLIRLTRELRDAATASAAPERLEAAVADAFSYLGFEARHIGGSGKTDVLATVEGSDSQARRIIIDAKSAQSGNVNEGAVSFDTLVEHRKQYGADHVALIGPGFETGRLKARAAQNQVALLTVESLIDAIRRHANSPQSAYVYLGLVESRPEGREELESKWVVSERRMQLLAQVVAVLARELAEADEITHGALSLDQIYLIVRDLLDPRPSPHDIEAGLELLEHPFIASVRRTREPGRKDGYRLVDPPYLIDVKLRAIASALRSISTED